MDLTVKGHLKVTGILTARHIQGGGTVEAGPSIPRFLGVKRITSSAERSRMLNIETKEERSMNIPKDTVVCYDNLTTTDLTVKGHLKVTGILTARHIL